MVDDDDAAAAIQTLVEIAQLNPTQARNALKHYGNSLENAVNAFFNGSLHFTETDGISGIQMKINIPRNEAKPDLHFS